MEGYPELFNDNQELNEFRDTMYAVLKYSGNEVVDINEFDHYIIKINNDNLTSRIGKHFCKILKNIQNRFCKDNNLRWYCISNLMAECGYIYPVPMQNMFATFDEDLVYQRYYVVINKTNIYDILFDSSTCKAVPDKCSAKICAEKFISSYVVTSDEKVLLNLKRKNRKIKFYQRKNYNFKNVGKSFTNENAKYARIALAAKHAKYVSSFSSREQCEKISQKIDEIWNINNVLDNHSKICYQKIKKYINNENDYSIDDVLNDIKEIENFAS